MASNKTPFLYSKSMDNIETTFMAKVQIGSTQAIKKGEILCYNKTAGYWTPVSAITDYIYTLAIANEEQKATDAERYILASSLHPSDKFEFELAAARSMITGDVLRLTTSNSQKLTYDADAFPVARFANYQNYPESGTTLLSISHAQVVFNPAVTYWGRIQSGIYVGYPVHVALTAATTLYAEMSGLIIDNYGASGATIHVLPDDPPIGTNFTALAAAAQDVGFDPPADHQIVIEGAAQTAGKYVSVDAVGDGFTVRYIGNSLWIGSAFLSSAADPTGAVDVEA